MAIVADNHAWSRRQAAGAATQFRPTPGVKAIAMPGADHGAGVSGIKVEGAKGMGAQAGKSNQTCCTLTFAGQPDQTPAHLKAKRQAGFKLAKRAKVHHVGETTGIPA